ncbi:MAG: hypothetical protein P8164_03165 [Gammaproteobacteria bacterium]
MQPGEYISQDHERVRYFAEEPALIAITSKGSVTLEKAEAVHAAAIETV